MCVGLLAYFGLGGSERNTKRENHCLFMSGFVMVESWLQWQRTWSPGDWQCLAIHRSPRRRHSISLNPTRWWFSFHPSSVLLTLAMPRWRGDSSCRVKPQPSPHSVAWRISWSESKASWGGGRWLQQTLRALWFVSGYLHSCPFAVIKIVKAHNQRGYVE